jgi:hypothetical protein
MDMRLVTIRANRQRTRFAASSGHRQERQLGLRRGPRTMLAAPRTSDASVRPLNVLRQASRGLVRDQGAWMGEGPMSVRRRKSIAWSRPPESGLRRVRPRSAAPWRG